MENDRTFGMLFATVSVPISDWWGGSHAVKRRKLELQKAEEQRADNAELLRIRTQKSWNDVEEARQQLLLAQHGIEQAEENLRLNRNYYHAGTVKMGDLLEAQLLYQQSLDKRTDAYRAIKDQIEFTEFTLPTNPNLRLVFDIYKTAKRDGKKSLELLEKIKSEEDPIMFLGLLASQAIKDFDSNQGIKEKRALKALARTDLQMKSTSIDPWLLIESFLLEVSHL